MPTPSGYSLKSYGNMVRCEPRMGAFDQALRDAIEPGCTVIDLGAGPGIFALLACKYGAGKVIAIEPDSSVELLHQFARDNGFADRIEIIHGLSSDYSPTQRADVIISDLRGGLPLFETHIAVIRDARERLLAPGGRLIPARDHLRIAAVETVEHYAPYENPWRTNAYDLDLTAGLRFVANQECRIDVGEDALLGAAQHIATLDYATITDPNLRRSIDLPIDRAGTMHGLLLWFDTELGGGAGYSNAPGQPPLVYSETFFPLERPLAVAPGDHVHADISANQIDGRYIWSWKVARTPAGGKRGAATQQSTFLTRIFSPADLAAKSDAVVPVLDEALAIDAYCLSLVDGRRSVRELAAAIAEKFPHAFANSGAAVSRVVSLVNR